MPIIKRNSHNPIISPNAQHAWEAEAAFNGCPVQRGKNIYLLYRALSMEHFHAEAGIHMRVSDIARATSRDGIRFTDRQRFIIPEESWERFGCEDPRVTKVGDTYYIFYTALATYPFTPAGIRVGVALSKDLKHVSEKHLVTPFNAKAMSLFPEKINGKFCAILTAHTDTPPARISVAYFKKLAQMWDESFWNAWQKNIERWEIPLQRRPQDHIEVGAPPIKTKQGWLLLYSCIRNYFSSGPKVFGIDAALLDLKNPQKILAQTRVPLMTPEELYEIKGLAPDIIFPSGALLKGDELRIYYGAADTTCCVAQTSLRALLEYLHSSRHPLMARRAENNPILRPDPAHAWEAKAVFNPAALYEDDSVHLVYRAMSEDNTSVFGYARSKDGLHINERSSEPIYLPRESFESKKRSGGNSGCEDPRMTKIGDTVYMLYTAYDGAALPRIALTSIPVKQFLRRAWSRWKKPILLSPPEFDNKDACLFPEKVRGKFLVFHRMGTDIDFALISPARLRGGTQWLEEQRWLKPRAGFWDSKKVGVAAPPVKTMKGWILLYHGVSESGTYRIGAVLLDKKDPTRILARTDYPILEPQTPYEMSGQVSQVVFPCGCVIKNDTLYIYYGGADTVVGAATMPVDDLLKILR